jgi:hypothetical protein
MRSIKQLGLLAIVAGALLIPAASASALTQVSCTFDGVTGNLNPGIPGIAQDLSPDSETGTFTYSGNVTCAGNDNGTPRQESGPITASGTYNNMLCGTGSAQGSSTVTLPSGTVNAQFVIQFRGGNGTIDITSAVRNNGETGTGAGDAQLRPVDGNCATTTVNTFQVLGGFAVTLA